MRRDSRIVGFQVILSHLFASQPECEPMFETLKKEEDKIFAKDIVSAFNSNRDELANIIDQHLVKYDRDRVYKIDLALLYLAVAEIRYIKTPFQIVINETCEIAKKYSTSKSAPFINGVLSSIIKDL